jgi:hypothetical protein
MLNYYDEEWKEIRGYEGYYDVSNYGRIRSLRLKKNTVDKPREVPLELRRVKNGKYLKVGLQNEPHYVHLLVLEHFVGLRPEGHVARFLNGITTDPRLENLIWKPVRRGIESHCAKLDEGKVRAIRHLCSIGKFYQKDIAEIYSVEPSTIYKILRREIWDHI